MRYATVPEWPNMEFQVLSEIKQGDDVIFELRHDAGWVLIVIQYPGATCVTIYEKILTCA